MRLNHIPLIVLSGLLWFIVGFCLLTLGLNFIVHAAQLPKDSFFLIKWLAPLAGSREQAAIILIIFSLMVGFMKGRFVLSKSANRVVQRILALPSPVPLSKAYSRGYLILIASMILLGMSLKWLHLPEDIRGVIDVAIGSALMNGALVYFRLAFSSRKQGS